MIIYKIENKINGKIYIGQTKKDVSRRIATHIKNNKHYVQKALNKYGLESFVISVIDEARTQESLDEKEKYWIKFYNCRAPKGYNCTDGGDGVRGYKFTEKDIEKNRQSHLGKKASEETKQRMSIAQKGKRISEEHKKRLSEFRKGTHPTEATRKKLSESHKGKQPKLGTHPSEETLIKMRNRRMTESQKQHLREINTGKHHSEETRRKMSEAQKGKVLSMERRDKIRASWVIRKQRVAA